MTPLLVVVGVCLTAVLGAGAGAIWWFASRGFGRSAACGDGPALRAEFAAPQPDTESVPFVLFSPPPAAPAILASAPWPFMVRCAVETKTELSDAEIDALPPDLPLAQKRLRGRPAIASFRV